MGPPIDWCSDESHTLINPRTPKDEYDALMRTLSAVSLPTAHVFLLTSGTSGKKKWVALAKKAILSSARAVNEHIQSEKKDVWINSLPQFHVGGLSIYARAFLSGSQVFDISEHRWGSQTYIEAVKNHSATLTSLVPTQVYDIVMHEHKCPPSLRAVFVGGGSLSPELYSKAVALQWPLLPSYGMTECSSQVATAAFGSWKEEGYPQLIPLKHIAMRLNSSGFFEICSEALLTGYVTEGEGFIDPKKDGWFTTEDSVTMGERGIKGISRGKDFAKVGGENVDLQRLQGILESACLSIRYPFAAAVVLVPEERLGSRIELVVEGPLDHVVDDLVAQYQQRVLPFERIRNTTSVEKIPRTSLGKIIK
jgi:O-succinylbenzoic acid--CoA ligase